MSDLIDRDKLLCAYCTDCNSGEKKPCPIPGRCHEFNLIKNAPAVNRWIPCSERLPHGGRVLATTKHGYVVDVIFVLKGSQWFRNGECFPTDTVIAWVPMPDAYKPPESEVQEDDER